MMPDNVRAAAERIKDGYGYAQCPDHCQECNDARTVAEYFLAPDLTRLQQALAERERIGTEMAAMLARVHGCDELDNRLRQLAITLAHEWKQAALAGQGGER